MQSQFEEMMKKLRVTPLPKALPRAEALRATASTLDLSPPQKVEVRGMDRARAAVDQQHAKINQVKKNLLQALEWERDFSEELASLKTPDERRLLKKELKAEADRVEAFLKERYAESDPIFRTAIVVTCIKFFLQKTFRSLEDYHAAAYQLRARHLMEHANKEEADAILIGYEFLKCVNCAAMERAEDAEIRQLAAFFSQTMQNEWNRRSKELEGQRTITLDQLLDGVTGFCYLDVDKEPYRRKGEDGKETIGYRFGGQLLVESKEGKVMLSDGVGGAPFTRWRDFVREKNVHLSLGAIRGKKPGHDKEGFDKLVNGVRKAKGLSQDDAKEYLAKLQNFWHLIRRAVKASRQEQEARVSKQD